MGKSLLVWSSRGVAEKAAMKEVFQGGKPRIGEGYSPLEEIAVFRLPDQARSHHDGLEALALDGPQVALGDRGDGRRPLAVVQDRQFAKDLRSRQCGEVLALAGNLDASIWRKYIKINWVIIIIILSYPIDIKATMPILT